MLKPRLSKQARIEIETTSQIKSDLEQAAIEEGMTLTSFVLNAATERAQTILESTQVTRLNQQAWTVLNMAIAKPAQATDALKDLMKI